MCLRFNGEEWSESDEDVMHTNLWRNNRRQIAITQTEVIGPRWFLVPQECHQEYEASFTVFLVNIAVDRVTFSSVKTSDIWQD